MNVIAKFSTTSLRSKRFCVVSEFSRTKTENPVPRSFFPPKPHGNACYAGYSSTDFVHGESTDETRYNRFRTQ